MAVFGQYDIEKLGQLHPQTVAALYQQAQRITRSRMRTMAIATTLQHAPKRIADIPEY